MEKLTKLEEKTEYSDRAKAVESAQECVVGNDKVGSLNTGKCYVDSDDVKNTVDTCEIISRVKPDLLSRLKSVAVGAKHS